MPLYENSNALEKRLKLIVELYFKGRKLKDILESFDVDKKIMSRNFKED